MTELSKMIVANPALSANGPDITSLAELCELVNARLAPYLTYRALPPDMLDLIAHGAHGSRKVRRAARRTAMSAQRRGWSEAQWRGQLQDGIKTPDGVKAVLWAELRDCYGRRIETQVHDIWQEAADHIAKDGANQAHARALASAWVPLVELLPLSERQLTAFRGVIAMVDVTGFHVVTCSSYQMADDLKLNGHRAALRLLKELTAYGVLTLHSPGRPSGTSGRGFAATYSLVDPMAFFTRTAQTNQA